MKKTKAKNLLARDSKSAKSSLVDKARQVMTIMIALGLFSMISSMLVSDNLSDDANLINKAGALRMQAVRISRATLLTNSSLPTSVANEIENFEQRFKQLLALSTRTTNSTPEIAEQMEVIKFAWTHLKDSEDFNDIHAVDDFVASVNHLVTLIQNESENNLRLLREIEGVSLLVVLVLAFFVLYRLHHNIIAPLKQLVLVAEQAGKGNFELKAQIKSENELGLLARTFNDMSSQLQLSYQDLEQRVEEKTRELQSSNESLEVLFRSARNLASYDYIDTEQNLIKEITQVLGYGEVMVERAKHNEILVCDVLSQKEMDKMLFRSHQFPLEKQPHIFGHLIWRFPKNYEAQDWQIQLLQAMADIIATAIELEQKRSTEDRLLISEERAVIARELHDSLAQSLSYLKMQTSLLTRKMQKDVSKEEVNETIVDLKEGLNSAYLQLRELLTTFRLKLDNPSIENAIYGTVTEFSAKCQHPIEFTYQLPQNYLSANYEIHLLQIIREALSNVQRHAQASSAGVSVLKDGENVSVLIWDDGIGLEDPHQQHGHFGLHIMQERAKSLKAKLTVEHRQPHGTAIKFQFKNFK